MLIFLLACQGEKTNTTDTHEELVETADDDTDTGSTTESVPLMIGHIE